MDKFDRIYALHSALANVRTPITKSMLEEKLECSHATIERIIRDMRLYLNAPIEYDRNTNGYFYNLRSDQKYELPGLWFNASELHALLTTYQLLSHVEPGLLEPHIAPLKDKINKLLHDENAGSKQIEQRVRLLKMAARRNNPQHFNTTASALLKRNRLFIRYKGREKNKETERTVSPQRLVHYRDNWYLDAWCHQKKSLRSFAIDRIIESRIENQEADDISEQQLDEHYATAYGIFAGKPKHKAVLRFNKDIARWVADEQWHPQQNGQYELDGSYTLEIPYGDPRELIMDILKYGANVEVVSPPLLRKEIAAQLQHAYEQYIEN